MRLLGLAVALAGACTVERPPSNADGAYTVDTVASRLEVPWALGFAPDGRIFVTERPGRIRVIVNGRLQSKPWATLPVRASGEAGLMGLALAPDFAATGAVYVVGTFDVGGRLVNRVVRLRDGNGEGIEPTTIVDGLPSGSLHAGDAIAFGPDGMLYVATGDTQQPRLASDRASLAGKILRFTPTGGVPADNPVHGSPVYAIGVRNPQGLTWSPGGQLFATDHGPSGFPNEDFRHDADELNAIDAGGDYGWPAAAGIVQPSFSRPPLAVWTPGIAPSGVAAAPGTAFGARTLFIGGLRGEQLRRIALDSSATGWRMRAQDALFEHTYGRIRAVAAGPDGNVYFTTSNRDGRGTVRPGDDYLLRLRPKR